MVMQTWKQALPARLHFGSLYAETLGITESLYAQWQQLPFFFGFLAVLAAGLAPGLAAAAAGLAPGLAAGVAGLAPGAAGLVAEGAEGAAGQETGI
jgi:hypothetical protein